MKKEESKESDCVSYIVTQNKPTIKEINDTTATIVQAYLDYTGTLVESVLGRQAYTTAFKDINDDLVLRPDELVELIDRIQRALVSVTD